jgi:integrase
VERPSIQEKAPEEEAMRGNRSQQADRGRWVKDQAERGIYRRGRTWYIRFADADGRIRAERVGPSKALALKVVAKRRTEVAERRFFPAASVTFDELIADAIAQARRDHVLKHPTKRFRDDRYRLAGEWFEGRRAASITPEEISVQLSRHCRTIATANRYRVALSHAFKLALQNRKAQENPASLVPLKKENNTRVRFLEPEEEQRLRAAIRRLMPERELEFELALYTGLRWEEQYALRWQDVDLARSEITLPETKSGVRQHVRLNAAARRALGRLRANAGAAELVCPAQTYNQHRYWWDRIRREAKVRDFRWHDLRHTFASRLVMAGASILEVNKLLRHETLQTTMKYAHLSDARLQRAVERLKPSVTRSDTAPARPAHRPAVVIQ